MALLVMLPGCGGCGGCRKDPAQAAKEQKEKERKEAEEKAKKEKEKPKPDFQVRAARTRPSSPQQVEPMYGLPGQPYKPGHWTSFSLDEAKANNFDFPGELEVYGADLRHNRAVPLLGVPYEMSATREIALPKGQAKVFESVLYVPPWVPTEPGQMFDAGVNYLFRRRGGARVYEGPSASLRRMPSYQYHFLVLARSPERYKYLDALGSIRFPGSFVREDERYYYRVAMPAAEKRSALPSYSLFWTGTACVLWDDAEPDALSPEQRQSLADWLHWGGQLILSGPDTLDTLKESFLAPYLPATTGGAREIAAADLAEWSTWAPKGGQPPSIAKPWTGVQLQLHPQARLVPGTGGLLAERRVGRGRTIVSAFRLSGRELTTWPGWDNFFNACLLRRPSRKFQLDQDGEVSQEWVPARNEHRLDAALTCNLRYFARDTGVPFGEYAADVVADGRQAAEALPPRFARNANARLPGALPLSVPPPGPGVAAWNDFSPVATSARKALVRAACIEIPRPGFVVWVVVCYLAVLVPLNWFVFRMLERVEWAWAATPVIAILCTLIVIRQAQLDIGFVRSRTEVGVVEIQGEYSRAHLSRYIALYTSLTTGYEFRCEEDPGGLVQPFPRVEKPGEFRMRLGESPARLEYRRGDDASLSGFSVGSNSLGLIHSEQMIDLGGPLLLVENSWGGFELVNRTSLALRGAGVIRKTPEGRLDNFWIGTIEPGSKKALVWSHDQPDGRGYWPAQRAESAMTAPEVGPGELSVRELTDLAEKVADDFEPGQVRLVAWVDQDLPGLSIRPGAPQARRGTLVVAHLRYGQGPDPKPDANSRRDVEREPKPAESAYLTPGESPRAN